MDTMHEYEARQLIDDRVRSTQGGSRVPPPRRRRTVANRLRKFADKFEN